MPYTNALFVAGIASLADRRDRLSRYFFKTVLQATSRLHYLVPRHLAMLNHYLASGLPQIPQNPESNKKISVNHFLRISSLSVVLVHFHRVIYVYACILSVSFCSLYHAVSLLLCI